MKHFLYFFFFVSSVWAISPNPVILNGSEKHMSLTPHVSYYIDTSSKMTLSSVLSKDVEFTRSEKEQLSFGHQYDATVWVKFTLNNSSDRSLEYLIEQVNPIIFSLLLYDAEGKHIGDVGILKMEKFSKTLGHTLKVSLPAQTSTTYYAKVNNHFSAMKLNFSLWNSDTYIGKKSQHWNIIALFSGAMLILILYNLALFFFTRDSSYLYYVLFTFAILVHEWYTSGYIFFYWHLNMIDTRNEVHLMVFFTFIFAPMFARSFLQLQTLMPRTDRYLKYLPIFLVVITLLTIYEVIPTMINRLSFVVSMISLVVISYIALIKGVRQARYYSLGWTVVFATFISMAFNRLGLFSFDPEPLYLIEVSLLFEALIFSMGLAARIRYVKEEKEISDAKLISHQQQEKIRLENEVSVRTEALSKALAAKNLLLKEVHHRVKNNMQIIVSLLRLQADRLDDDKLLEVMSVSEQRIKAMGSVHEMLYAHDDITEINLKEYFHVLAEEVRSAYDSLGNIVVTIETDITLGMEHAVYTGLIINELVSNAYKHAFGPEGGKIDVTLALENDEHVLRVNDNGKGGELGGSINSLGMTLVDTLVVQQLNGSIITSSDKGVSHTIRFNKDVL